MKLKYVAIFLVLLCCLMGAASATEDVSADVVDASADAVVVDAVSEDVSDSVESIDDEVEPVVDEFAVGSVDEGDIVGDAEITLGPDDFGSQYKVNENSIINLQSGEYIDVYDQGWDLTNGGQFNVTIIGQNRENTLITNNYYGDVYPILWGLGGNYKTDCSITWINVTFKDSSYMQLDRINFNFINCTFEQKPIKIDSNTQPQPGTDIGYGFIYNFDNCLFKNYASDDLSFPSEGFIQDSIIESHVISKVIISNCVFENIAADSIFTTFANYDSINDVKAGLIVKNSTFNNVAVKAIAKVPTDLLSNVKVEDCEYIGFEATTNPVEDGDYTYLNATKLKVVAVDSVVDISSPEKGVIVITLTDNSAAPIAGATFKYSVNGEEKTDVTGEDGKFTISGLTGEVTIAVNYEGNESYNAVQGSQVFNFTEEPVVPAKVATKITAPKVSAVYNVAKNLVITLTDKDGKALANKKVTVKVGTISKTLTTNAKGQVSLNVATLVPKTYTATVKFAGDDGYLASSVSPKVVVSKAKPKITAKAKTFKVKVKTKKYTVTLKNNKGKVLKKVKLTLKVGKKTYKATTNSKGKATFKITKLSKKGKYTATVKFAGSKYYKALSKKVKITVKK